MALPLELLTMMGSTILGGAMTLWKKSLEQKFQTHVMSMENAAAKMKAFEEARQAKEKEIVKTRKVIAITAVLAIMVLPKLAAIFYPEVNIFYGHTEIVQKGWWIFTSPPADVTLWKAMKGIVVTPVDSHLLAAIGGLYFGGSLTK